MPGRGKPPSCLTCICPCGFGQMRFVIVAISFFSIIISHCQRAVLSIAIVEMVGGKNVTAIKSTCPTPHGASHVIPNIGGGKVDWSEKEQNLNIASFYIGYFLMHLPFGILSDIYGARHPLIWGMVVSTIGTGLIPPATMYLEWWWVFILRICIGFGQSAQYPCLSSLMGRWTPPCERGTTSAIIFASNSIGYIVANLCSGMMIMYTENWTVPFYVWSGTGFIFMLLALLYLFSDPRSHPYLHEIEREYLRDMIIPAERMTIPVRQMAKDWCVYGLVIGQIGHDMIMFTLANNLPKYVNNVLGLNIQANAFFSFVYAAQAISAYAFGVLSDRLINRNANLCLVRKVYTNLSLTVPGITMLGVSLVRCNLTYVLCLLLVTIFFNGLNYCGLKVHILDVCVNHAGLLMAIINGMGALSGFFSSFAIGYIAKDNTHAQWDLVLCIMLGVECLTGFLYSVMTTCARRPWDIKEGEGPKEMRRAKKCYLQLSPSSYEEHRAETEAARRVREESVRAARMKKHASYVSLRQSQSNLNTRK